MSQETNPEVSVVPTADRPFPELLTRYEEGGLLNRAEQLWKDLQANDIGGFSGRNRPFYILHEMRRVIEDYGHRDTGLKWSNNDLDAARHRLAHQTPPATQPSATVGEDQPYPASQEEARMADGWRFHYGSRCPADCDEVYYRRKSHPDEALGPTPPHLIRWTDTGDGSDILAWHPVYSGFQRRHRLATLHTPPPVATATVVDAGWQDIASVPAEGPPQQIVVLIDGDEPMLVNAPFFTHNGERSCFSVETSNIRRISRATHWMPLPATPTPTAGD